MAVVNVPMSRDLSLLFKAGLGWERAEARYLLPYVRCTPERPDCAQVVAREHQWGPVLGAALRWGSGPWSVRVQYDVMPSSRRSTDALSMGFYRHFR